MDAARESLISKWYYIPNDLLRYVRGAEAIGIDDLLQAGRLGLIHAALRYDPARAEFSTYAYRACWSKMLMLILREQKARGMRAEDYPLEEIPAREPYEPRADFSPLYHAIRCLPNRWRDILYWHFWAGKTLEQIGRMLSITRQRVQQIEARALDKLRRILKSPEAAVA